MPNVLAHATTNYFFLRSFLLTSETKLPLESRLKLRFLAAVVIYTPFLLEPPLSKALR